MTSAHSVPDRRRARFRTAALLVAGTALLVACGSGGGAGDPAADGRDTVRIEHRYGATDVPVRPERIVSLDVQWTDVLLALDAPPIGYLADPNVEGGSFPWRGDGLHEADAIEATDALPWERIAALDPDLIVVSYLAQDEADYRRLSAIAPTIPSFGDEQVLAWQDIAEVAGTVLGQEDRAAAIVDEVDDVVTGLAADLPGLEGRTFALVNYVPGDAFYIVSDPTDGAVVLFDQLGMSVPPAVLEAGDGVAGRVEVSLERSSLLDADLLLLLTNGGDEHDIVGYDQLPAVRSGAVHVLDYTLATALNTPTPLSIPYVLDALRPALEAAAA